jgi:tRNA G46 methylase TrmB
MDHSDLSLSLSDLGTISMEMNKRIFSRPYFLVRDLIANPAIVQWMINNNDMELSVRHSIKFRCNKQLYTAIHDVFWQKCYDAFRPKDGDTIMDCGAHIGTFTIKMAREAARTRIISIEGSEETFRYLRHNISANNVDADLINKYISDKSSRETNRITLHDLLEEKGIETVNILKMDIEGDEAKVFGSMSEDDFNKIEKIVMEIHPHIVGW